MERPHLTIPTTPLDRVLEVVAIFSLIASIVLTVWHYSALPETVESHFNLSGVPDDTGPKKLMWLLPIMATVIYAGLTWLTRRPHALNYPVEITESNASAQYSNAVVMIRLLKTVILGQSASLIFFQHKVVLGHAEKLPGWWLPVTMICVLGTVVWYIVRAFRLQ